MAKPVTVNRKSYHAKPHTRIPKPYMQKSRAFCPGALAATLSQMPAASPSVMGQGLGWGLGGVGLMLLQIRMEIQKPHNDYHPFRTSYIA